MNWIRLESYRDHGLLLLRLGFGLGFLFFHGWDKLSGGVQRWRGVGSAVEHLGIEFGHVGFGLAASLAESLGGLLIAAGLFFRPACVFLALTMLVAVNRHVVTGQGTPAHAFKNAFVALGLLFLGPGQFSLDAWLERRRAPLAT